MNPMTLAFAGRGSLEQTQRAEYGQSCCKALFEIMLVILGRIMDVLKEGAFTKIALKPVFALSPGYAHLPTDLSWCMRWLHFSLTENTMYLHQIGNWNQKI